MLYHVVESMIIYMVSYGESVQRSGPPSTDGCVPVVQANRCGGHCSKQISKRIFASVVGGRRSIFVSDARHGVQ